MKIFTIATAHLDTSWLWTLETTVKRLIPNTMRRNFKLFEKYPAYRFNFEGAYRYELMEEYYPEDFARVKEYARQGRWAPTGSSYENGDVNTPSPEALFRSILLGNDYFEKNFGQRCVDIYLPDCFGFGYALPAVMAHSGLYGFTTCKLTWGSSAGRPFDIGRWVGVGGSAVFASIRPGPYSASPGAFRGDKGLADKLARNAREHNLPFTCKMYGTGDMGGAPSAYSVRRMSREARANGANEIQVVSARARDAYDAILTELTPEQIAALPVHEGEFLLTEHGAGSYTSRAIGHRWNRRCEQLADAAERALAAADWLGVAVYPKERLTEAWKRVLAHHFHDDITGTAFQACYRRNWNDYILSLNQLAEEYTYANRALSSQFDTSFAKGTPVIVNNTLQYARSEAVSAALPIDAAHVKVLDSQGVEVPAQVSGGVVTFLADLPGLSWKAYDIRPEQPQSKNHLRITERSLENERLIVTLDDNGDIASIFDKKSNREALSAPVRMAALPDSSARWPAWEVAYADVMSGDKRYPTGAQFKIAETGPARASLEITRALGQSRFTQRVSLDAGAAWVRCDNEIDWRETGTLLKAEFPFSVSNEHASYDLGLGVRERPTNSEKLHEAPLQNWMDITAPDGSYGVSVLSDSKSGADKPAGGTLRLTLIHTPAWPYRWEASQHLMDQGLNRFAFGVCPHAGGYQNGTQAAAAAFNQPMGAFVTESRPGRFSGEYSFGSLSDGSVILRAVKKAENEEKVVVRFNEGAGKQANGVRFALGDGIESAVETLADETRLHEAAVEGGALVFDMRPFEVKTFALALKKARARAIPVRQEPIPLPHNVAAVTPNGRHTDGETIPMELYPDAITSGGVRFVTSKESLNAMACRGQAIALPQGAKRAHLLLCSLSGDASAVFRAGETPVPVTVLSAAEAIGRWDMVGLGETGRIKRGVLAWNATHTHGRRGDIPGKQFYLFKHSIELGGAQALTVPKDETIVLFALTADFDAAGAFSPGTPLYDELEPRPFDYDIPPEDLAKARPTRLERLLEHVVRREKIITVSLPNLSGVLSVADAYAAVRQATGKWRARRAG
ncbi:MAG: glycosyl hydrolase-related protein [Oscillospiraceae bacterium]|jgi:alpha-mannosidase|nr:glycosyl hydrolase-related protein [Oscillospiraceae bacterium]